MDMKYNLAKLIVGVGNIGYILYNSLSGNKKSGCWGVMLGILLVFMVIKSVSFIREQESTWVFLVSAIATIPFNIKLASIAVDMYLIDGFALMKILFGIVVYLCILSAEEILFGVMARIIWAKQNESFLYAINKEESDFD